LNFIANPIASRIPGKPLRVLVVVREDRFGGPSAYIVRDKLELVHYDECQWSFCNTNPGETDPNLMINAANELVAEKQIDLVVMEHLRCISDWFDRVVAFLRLCVANGTRVVSFDDRFDTADADWEQTLFDDLFT
jgi:hypothetical protein